MTADTELPPGRFGDFLIERALGHGGMASVYLARDAHSRPLALKVMQAHLRNDASFVQRFVNEARATVGFRHPNVVGLLSWGEAEGRYFIAYEYVDGGTVEDLLRRMGRLPGPLALEVFAQLLEALKYAHAQGVIHRDLKPANLLLTRDGVLKVGDFGIARSAGGAALTQTGALIGTPAYMSPEQALGKSVDGRSDLFSAGIVLYELVTGTNPFLTDNPTTTLTRVLQVVVPPVFEVDPTVPRAVERTLERLLQADPAQRFADADEALRELSDALHHLRARHPSLLRDALVDPEGTRRRLCREQAAEALAEARELVSSSPENQARAALVLYRAVLLDPDNAEARDLFGQVCQEQRLRFENSTNPKIAELERALEEKPDAPAVLQQLANLYRLEGNLVRAVTYMKRYLKVRPHDGYVAGQLSHLTGEAVQLSRVKPGPSGVTSAAGPSAGATDPSRLLSGVRTGGFAAAPPVPASATLNASAVSEGTAPSTTPRPLPNPSPSHEPLPGVVVVETGGGALHSFWHGGGAKLVGVLVVVGLLYAAVKGVGRFIDSAVDSSVATTDAIITAREKERAQHEQRELNRAIAERRAEQAQALYEQALAHHTGGDCAQAVPAFESFLSSEPDAARAAVARVKLGSCYLDTSRLVDAERLFSDAVAQHAGRPEYAEALLGRGQARHRLGDHPRALEDLGAFLQNFATHPLAVAALLERGRLHAGAGREADARADLQAVVERTGPSDPVHQQAREALGALAPEKPARKRSR